MIFGAESTTETTKTALPPPRPVLPSDRDEKRGLRLSLALHVALALFILIKTLVFPSNPVPFIPSLRVDLVGLPDQLRNELIRGAKTPLPPLPEETKETQTAKSSEPAETADPDEMVLKPRHPKAETPRKSEKEKTRERERKIKGALARIKALAKITADSSPAKASDSEGTLIKGNRISKGTSLSGEAREAAEASYYDLLRDRLQENWELPVWIARQNLSAQVQLFIDSRGQVRSFRFVKGSGNSQFDDAVRRTISESQPFTPPPAELASSTLTNGILVGFPL